MTINPLTPKELRKLLRYDPDTGKLFWRRRVPDVFHYGSCAEKRGWCSAFNGRFSGREAFTCNSHGYRTGRIFNTQYAAHRVAWAIHYGVWPSNLVDHINQKRNDNRISNLRNADRVINAQNTKIPADNKSGVVGVHWSKRYQKWVAQIGVKGTVYLGRYEDMQDAITARMTAEIEHGFHKNHGEIR